MAKALMSCLKKRGLIQEVTTDRETLIKFGQEYLQQGRWLEALEFFERAPDPEGLQTLKKRGLEEGDPFLYKQACRFLKEIDWRKGPFPRPMVPGPNRLQDAGR
jgi:hypothetical protein